MNHPVITGIAEAHEVLPSVVVLRWLVQLGVVAIPKSSNRERLHQNLRVNDLSLSVEDIASLTAIDQEKGMVRLYTDPRSFSG